MIPSTHADSLITPLFEQQITMVFDLSSAMMEASDLRTALL